MKFRLYKNTTYEWTSFSNNTVKHICMPVNHSYRDHHKSGQRQRLVIMLIPTRRSVFAFKWGQREGRPVLMRVQEELCTLYCLVGNHGLEITLVMRRGREWLHLLGKDRDSSPCGFWTIRKNINDNQEVEEAFRRWAISAFNTKLLSFWKSPCPCNF